MTAMPPLLPVVQFALFLVAATSLIGTRGPRLSRLSHGVILLLPLLVAVCWWASGGFPYFKDSNETFLSYLHGLNLVRYNPWSFAFLTAEGTAGTSPAPLYTHNPNFPRYVHAALLLLGLHGLTTHALIIPVAVSLLGMLALWYLLRALAPDQPWLAPVAVVLATLDLAGVGAWAVNTFRAWSFPLVWGCLLVAVVAPRWWLTAGLAFCLFQFEYAFALFAGVAVGVAAVGIHGRHSGRVLGPFALGAAASLALFAVQVLTVLEVDGAWAAFLAAGARRAGVGATTYAMILDTLWDYLPLWVGWPLTVLACWGPISAVLRLARGCRRDPLAWATLGLWAGGLAVALVLRDWFEAAMVRTWLPYLVFLVHAGLWCVLADVGRLRPVLVVPPALAVAVLLLVASRDYLAEYPLLDASVVSHLERDYQGAAFLGGRNFHVLAAVTTGGRAYAASSPPTEAQIASVRAMLPPDAPLYVLCVERPWMGTHCTEASIQRVH